MKFILGKKIGMTRVFEEGKMIPVTLIEVNPCVITQIKNVEIDGYDAVQLSCGSKKEKNITKPILGHIKKAGFSNSLFFREFRLADDKEQQYSLGKKVDISIFEKGEDVKLISVSKGKGFQGVVKRHGFKGHPASHGTKHAKRQPGSLGPTFPEHVIKGRRMAGRMGSDQITIKSTKIINIEKENNLLIVKGSFAGNRGTLVKISTIK